MERKNAVFISKPFARHFAAKVISQSRAPCRVEFFFARTLGVCYPVSGLVCVSAMATAKAKFNGASYFSAS